MKLNKYIIGILSILIICIIFLYKNYIYNIYYYKVYSNEVNLIQKFIRYSSVGNIDELSHISSDNAYYLTGDKSIAIIENYLKLYKPKEIKIYSVHKEKRGDNKILFIDAFFRESEDKVIGFKLREVSGRYLVESVQFSENWKAKGSEPR